jgi:hypothetical protein
LAPTGELLKIEGNVPRFKAKSAHFVGHLPCAAAIQKGKGGLDSIIDLIFMESIVLENLSLEQ